MRVYFPPLPGQGFFFFLLFLKDFIFLFLERGEGREKERKRNINVWLPLARPLLGTWPTTQAGALTGNRIDSLVRRPVALNPLSHTSRAESVLLTGRQHVLKFTFWINLV